MSSIEIANEFHDYLIFIVDICIEFIFEMPKSVGM